VSLVLSPFLGLSKIKGVILKPTSLFLRLQILIISSKDPFQEFGDLKTSISSEFKTILLFINSCTKNL
jgi:hypothetical protein